MIFHLVLGFDLQTQNHSQIIWNRQQILPQMATIFASHQTLASLVKAKLCNLRLDLTTWLAKSRSSRL